MRSLYKNLIKPKELDPKVLYLLLKDVKSQRFYYPSEIVTYIWPYKLHDPQRAKRERAIHYNQVRHAVHRLRYDGNETVPILNRGTTNGPYYIPRIGEEKLAVEDLAMRRRMSRAWDHNTDILEESVDQHLTMARLIKVSV